MTTKKATKTAAKKSSAKSAAKTAVKKSVVKKSAASEPAKAAAKTHPTHQDIAHRAAQLWNERGRPEGSAHIDWHKAEEELKG